MIKTWLGLLEIHRVPISSQHLDHRLLKRLAAGPSQFGGFRCARLVRDIAFNEDGADTKIAAELDVGERIPNHDACGEINVGKLSARLMEQTY